MFYLEILLLGYFAYVTSYSLLLSVAGALFYRNRDTDPINNKSKFAVFIPAYKEDGVIYEVAKQALLQNYPKEKFDVIVIADSLQQSTLEKLKTLNIIVVEVSFVKSTKVRALNRAMEQIDNSYDFAIVLDADNVMEPDFINKVNSIHALGYHAIQANRSPKNDNTSVAVLDGLSETINNFIYRQGTVSLGMSSSLNGSGMSFKYSLFKDTLSKMDSIGGFDRELELKLIEKGTKVFYARNIIVLDEKVQNTKVFENQRKRWISSQFVYLKKYLIDGFIHLFKLQFTYFNSAVLRNIQLPRLINLGLLFFICIISYFIARYLNFDYSIWYYLLIGNLLAMAISTPAKYYSVKTIKALSVLPAIFLKMFLILFKLKNANKDFIHTPHHSVENNKVSKDDR